MKRQFISNAVVMVCVTTVLTGQSQAATVIAATKSSSKDMDSGAWIMVAGFVFIIALMTFMALVERGRSKKIKALAASLGVPFRKKPTQADSTLITGCSLDRTRPITAGTAAVSIAGTLLGGNDMLFHNDFANVVEVTQTEELKLTVFDLESSIGSGKGRRSSYYTVSRAQSPLFALPMPALGPFLEPSSPYRIEGNGDLVFLHLDRRVKTQDYAQFIEQTKRIAALILEGQRAQPAT